MSVSIEYMSYCQRQKPHIFGRTWNVRRMAPEVDRILDRDAHMINYCQMLFTMNVRVDFEVHIWNDRVGYHICTWWTKPRGKSGIAPRSSKLMAYHCEALRPMVTGLPTLITAAILGYLSGSQIRLVRAISHLLCDQLWLLLRAVRKHHHHYESEIA